MIKIDKGPEPSEWTKYKLTPGVTYSAIPELRKALLEEQGYLCAYCLGRIYDDPNKTKIEHLKSRKNHPNLALDYHNMVVCCPGNLNGAFHCDTAKGDQDISFSPFSSSLQDSIRYSSKSGEISSSDENWDRELREVVKLNHNLLKANRLETLRGVIMALEQKQWRRNELRIKLDEWQRPHASGKKKPYCGIVIWFLKKKLP
jgi:uncharacterized protein (TIGR02646 family)